MEDRKEIFFCNLTLENKKSKIVLKEVVYKEENGYYKNTRLGIKEPLKVLNVDVICSLGFENKNKGYDIGIKSEEKRNNITGAYE